VDYNGIPEIDNRKFKSSVRLRDGEWAVVTGLLSRTDATTLAGIAGLSNIPILGRLLSTNTKSDDRTTTLLVIKPRLMNMPPSESTSPTLLTGTETKPISLL
jgi:general secretion pathway protein D